MHTPAHTENNYTRTQTWMIWKKSKSGKERGCFSSFANCGIQNASILGTALSTRAYTHTHTKKKIELAHRPGGFGKKASAGAH